MRLPLTATELVRPSLAAPPPAMPAMRPSIPSNLTCVFSFVLTSAWSAGAKMATAISPLNILRDMTVLPPAKFKKAILVQRRPDEKEGDGGRRRIAPHSGGGDWSTDESKASDHRGTGTHRTVQSGDR